MLGNLAVHCQLRCPADAVHHLAQKIPVALVAGSQTAGKGKGKCCLASQLFPPCDLFHDIQAVKSSVFEIRPDLLLQLAANLYPRLCAAALQIYQQQLREISDDIGKDMLHGASFRNGHADREGIGSAESAQTLAIAVEQINRGQNPVLVEHILQLLVKFCRIPFYLGVKTSAAVFAGLQRNSRCQRHLRNLPLPEGTILLQLPAAFFCQKFHILPIIMEQQFRCQFRILVAVVQLLDENLNAEPVYQHHVEREYHPAPVLRELVE